MDNLEIYNKVRVVPKEALKEIQAGRLKGKSDINPMWRIKALTECFGLCGIGWKYEIISERLEEGGKAGEVAAFVQINLYIKVDGAWSDPIPGTGGSSFIANESKGLYMSDECFKMALTDAISVSCKALGFAADVYWDKDATKYTERPQQTPPNQQKPPQNTTTPPQQNKPSMPNLDVITEGQAKRLFAIAKGNKEGIKSILLRYGYTSTIDIKKSDYEKIVADIEKL